MIDKVKIMLTENQKIMQAILNDDPNMEAYATGYEVFHNLRGSTFIDNELEKLLWKVAKKEKTFFGEGFIDEHFEHDNSDDEETEKFLMTIVKAFVLAGLQYDQEMTSQPIELLADIISELFEKEHDLDRTSEELLTSFLPNLIECDSLASWLLVSQLPAND